MDKIRAFFSAVKAFFTPARRKAIYGVVGGVFTLLLAFNIITADQMTSWLDILTRAFAAAATLMAFFNTDTSTSSGMPSIPLEPGENDGEV